MSNMKSKKTGISTDLFVNRLELLIKNLKKTGIDLEAYPGLKRQSKSQYKTQGQLPSFTTLALWAEKLDVNLHWLLLGEGEMLRTPQQAGGPEGETEALRQRVADMEKTIAAQEKLIAMYEEREHVPMPESMAGNAPITTAVTRSLQDASE
jgi:transcriptional regulator with XRE-family HTH domain